MKVVVIDNGLLVSKVILVMRENGVKVELFVKQWSILIPGSYVNEYFGKKHIAY